MMKYFTLILAFFLLSLNSFSQKYIACARSDKEWGYINEDGSWLINPQFEHVHNFSEGYAAMQKGGEWGFVDKTGRFAINPQFDDVSEFKDGLAAVRKGKEWGNAK